MIVPLLIAAVCAANVPAENELLRELPGLFASRAEMGLIRNLCSYENNVSPRT